ncbi:MAG: hypothetical protein IJK63_02310 [Oscillospiraceae bacterium]|nr:hypothetical protein [Oscillospiraceae bacterium]
MKTTRRLLCLALALVFAAALLPAAALAEDGHTHDWQERSRTEPTCTKEGSVTYTCSCGEKRTEILPALGHDWDEGKIVDDPHNPGGLALRFRCKRCDALMFRALPQEETEDDYGWEPPEEPEEPEEPEIPDGAVSPAGGEAEGKAKIELEYRYVTFINSMRFRPGCKVWLRWNLINTGDVTVYDVECELYRWNKNAGAYVPFDPGDALDGNKHYKLYPSTQTGPDRVFYSIEPYIFSEEDLENAKDGFLEIMVIGRAKTEDGAELEAEPLIYRFPIFDPSLVVEAEDCSAGQIPEGGHVKVGLTATSTGTETFTYKNLDSIGYDKDGFSFFAGWTTFLDGDLSWVAPGKPGEAEVSIYVTEADVEAGEVRRDLTLWFMRRYRPGGGTVYSDTPEDQIVSIEDASWLDVYPSDTWFSISYMYDDFSDYPITVEIVVPLLEPPEEPAPVPEREPRPFCAPALTGLGEGTAEWTLNRCDEHAALARDAKGKTPEEALALWQEALDAEYAAWLAEAEESLRPAIETERDAFREQLEAYRALWAGLGGEELGAEKAAELAMHKLSLLCFARQADAEAWAAVLSEAESLDAAESPAACQRQSRDSVTELLTRETLCEEHRGLGLAAEDEEGRRELKTLWLAALNAETDACWLSADEEARPLLAEARQSFGRWLKAEEALLSLQFPEDPALVQQLLALAVRSRALDFCGA